MIALAVSRDVRLGVCGVCGVQSMHYRACGDCSFTVARCDACGGNKAASREAWIHRLREHGVQITIAGTETPGDPDLEIGDRPRERGDCDPCLVCQTYFDGDAELPNEIGVLPCGHEATRAPNHCRPCPWIGCRHHALIEIAHAKPRKDRNGRKRDARPTSIRLNRDPGEGHIGRRGGLHAQDSTDVVQRWIDNAVDHLETMPETCTLDVADKHVDGLQLTQVAELFGVTCEALRQEEMAAQKMREVMIEYEDHVPSDRMSALARAGVER